MKIVRTLTIYTLPRLWQHVFIQTGPIGGEMGYSRLKVEIRKRLLCLGLIR